MTPVSNPRTEILEHLRRKSTILQIDVRRDAQAHPPSATVKQDVHERSISLDELPIHELRNGGYVLQWHVVARRVARGDGQADVGEEDPVRVGDVERLGAERLHEQLLGLLRERGAISADGGVTATDLVAKLAGGANATVRGAVDGGEVLELPDHGIRLGGRGHRVVDRVLAPAWLEAVRRGQRGTDQVLVALGDEKRRDGPRHEEPLVAVGDEEVRVQLAQIQGDVSDAVRGVDQAEHAFLATHLDESLERHAQTRHADDRVEGGQTHTSWRPSALALRILVLDRLAKQIHESVVTLRQVPLDPDTAGGRRFHDVVDCLL